MGRKSKKDLEASCCTGTVGMNDGDSKVEAIISVDERGQMVLPKEVREKVGIKAGDKLVVISRKDGDTICCISLIKTDYFMGVLNDRLGPVMNELLFKK